MRTFYTIQVSNHPDAGSRIPTDEAQASWVTKYDGPIASANDARRTVDELSRWFRNVRSFRGGKTIGKLWYSALRGKNMEWRPACR